MGVTVAAALLRRANEVVGSERVEFVFVILPSAVLEMSRTSCVRPLSARWR